MTALRVLMPVLRQTAYAPDGKPPTGYSERRDASCFKAMLNFYGEDEIIDALYGVRAVADGALKLPEGGTPWLQPGEKFTARFLIDTRWGARPLLDTARDVWRSRPLGTERTGTATRLEVA